MTGDLSGPGIYGPPLPARLPAADPGLADAAPRPFRKTIVVAPNPNTEGLRTEFDLPVGTRALGFTWGLANSSNINIAVTGMATGTVYMDLQMTGLAYKVCPVFSSADPTVQVTLLNLGTTAITITVVALGDGEGSIIIGETGTLIPAVFLRDSSANFIDSDFNATLNSQSLAVTLKRALPAPWQAPTLTVTFDVSLNNSSAIVVPLVSGQRIYVHSWMCTFSAVVAATVILEQDDTAKQFAVWNNVATVGPFPGDSKGAYTDVGRALRLRNPFAVATTARGHVTYQQAA